MTRTVTFSPRAISDIGGIFDYTADHWNIEQAELYVRQIKTAVDILAVDPRRGRSCDNVRPGYRRYSVGTHIIFYREARSGLEVIRVLHQRMDFSQHL
jgi:toxin ParE1/3/4